MASRSPNLTLNDFRTDLSGFLRDNKERMEAMPLGTYAVAPALRNNSPDGSRAGCYLLFCAPVWRTYLRQDRPTGYHPLSPHYVVHMSATMARSIFLTLRRSRCWTA